MVAISVGVDDVDAQSTCGCCWRPAPGGTPPAASRVGADTWSHTLRAAPPSPAAAQGEDVALGPASAAPAWSTARRCPTRQESARCPRLHHVVTWAAPATQRGQATLRPISGMRAQMPVSNRMASASTSTWSRPCECRIPDMQRRQRQGDQRGHPVAGPGVAGEIRLTSLTVPSSMPPEPVTGFASCRARTNVRSSAILPSSPPQASYLGKEAESTFRVSTAMRSLRCMACGC